MCAQGLPICDDLTPQALRRLARREPDRAAAGRMFAIANALEGMSRAEVARLAGMERQAVRAGDASRLDRSDEPVPRRGQPTNYAIVDACCMAWNKLTPKRIVSLCNDPYVKQVNL